MPPIHQITVIHRKNQVVPRRPPLRTEPPGSRGHPCSALLQPLDCTTPFDRVAATAATTTLHRPRFRSARIPVTPSDTHRPTPPPAAVAVIFAASGKAAEPATRSPDPRLRWTHRWPRTHSGSPHAIPLHPCPHSSAHTSVAASAQQPTSPRARLNLDGATSLRETVPTASILVCPSSFRWLSPAAVRWREVGPGPGRRRRGSGRLPTSRADVTKRPGGVCCQKKDGELTTDTVTRHCTLSTAQPTAL